MAVRLAEREKSVLVYLGCLVKTTHRDSLGPLWASREEIDAAASALNMDSKEFRLAVRLLAHGKYLEQCDQMAQGLLITLTPTGYLAYAMEAFANFNDVRTAVEQSIVATPTTNIEIARTLNLPQFQVDIVFSALENESLIKVMHLAAGQDLMEILEVSPVLELRHR